MRQRYVIGNWKMNGSLAANATLLTSVRALPTGSAKVAVCAPFPYLAQAQAALHGSAVAVGAQDLSAQASGAYTGQVSAPMLREFGCEYVLVGHSERRQGLGETDAQVGAKAVAARAHGLVPVVCVGELLAEREAGHADAVVLRQLAAVADALGSDLSSAIIAYEPVWAIGTGKTASPEAAQAMHATIRGFLRQRGAQATSVLYGGSVKADNASILFGQADIDGGLIGGAALDAQAFAAIVAAAG
jgi:triosephosphate isomerase (TIM)